MKNFMLFAAVACCMHFASYASSNSPIPRIDPSSEEVVRLKELNKKAHKNFLANFKYAEDVKVITNGENVFVYCKENGIQTKILYCKDGTQVYALKYFNADNLPSEVKAAIKHECRYFTILHGTEVTDNKGTAFMVNVQHNNTNKTIRVINGAVM